MNRILACSIVLLCSSAAAQAQTASSDSVALAPSDSLTAADSLQVPFIPGMGASAWTAPLPELDWYELLWLPVRTADDFSWRVPGLFLRDHGEAGKPSQLTANGADIRHIAVMLDGRPMNDPITGAYTLSDLPLEFVDAVEYHEGSSLPFVSPASVAALNMVSRSYNSFRPITRIRYVEAPKGTLLTDMFYTQNVLRGVNLQIGVLRQASDGRIANAAQDAWTLRSRVRFNADDRINAAFTHLYTRSSNGLNGGADLSHSFSAQQATPLSRYSYEIRIRHDLTMAAIGRLFADSASTTHATAYMTTMEREYNAGTESNLPPARSRITEGSLYGIRLEQRLQMPMINLALAAEREWRGSERSDRMPLTGEYRTALAATAEMTMISGILPTGAIRIERMYGAERTSVSLGLHVSPFPSLRLEAEAGTTYRFPTLQEMYWQDSLLIRRSPAHPEKHYNARVGLALSAGTWGSFKLAAFRRTIHDAILFRPDTTRDGMPAIGLIVAGTARSDGLTGSMSISWNGLEFSGTGSWMQFSEESRTTQPVPEILMAGELSYHGRFFDGSMDARVGGRVRFSDRFRGAAYDAVSGLYYENTRFQLGRATTFDVFGVMHVGDAYVTLAMQNILSTDYLTIPVYPMPPRQLIFGVNWTFSD